jgi:LysR family glycine cleavage system transcriptional activator
MNRKLPPLNAIRTFEAVGRHGSISGAAKELLVTEPAVSRALKNLEEHFGLALFHRTSSGLKLTEHGKLLLPDVSTALDRIAIASSLVYEQRRYSVSLLATPFIAAHWISKHVKDFLGLEPGYQHSHSQLVQIRGT